MAHPLSGADLGTLTRVFRDGGRPQRLGTAAAIWGAALGRAPFTALEHALIASRLPSTVEMEPPIFILGHWRSGTTHLYNVMSLGGFGYVPPVAVGIPWDMFGLGRALKPMLERALPAHRWIDKIPVTPTSPQEDEVGVANMSPLSFYHGIYFPERFDALIDRGLFFDGCTPEEIDGWRERFTYFMRKLALDQNAPLLIKNPVYTARPEMLKELFPDAKFIHIHRSPFDVFLSMRNFYKQLLKVMALQPYEHVDVDETILRVYERMMDAFVAQTAGWTAPDIVEIGYDRLDQDPIGALREIYETLELPGFATAEPTFRAYLDSVKSFEKNRFKGGADAIEKVETRLGAYVRRWGYAAPPPADAA